jgi:hypothetical protein
MTTPANDRVAFGTGDGIQTVFFYDFPCTDETELIVVVDTVTISSGLYTVDLTAKSITFTTAPADTAAIAIAGKTVLAQVVQYSRSSNSYQLDALEDQLDRTVETVQELRREDSRTPKMGYGVPAPDIAALEMNKVLLIDPTGTKIIMGPTADEISLAQGYAEAAGTSAATAILEADYAEEWAQSPDPISVGAGGDGATDRSSKYWAEEAADYAALALNNWRVEYFAGDTVETDFELALPPGTAENIFVMVDNAFLSHTSYSLVGATTLRFTEAPLAPEGGALVNIEVAYGYASDPSTPAAAISAASAEADAIATAADRVQTGLDAVATAADRVQTGLDATAASGSATAAAASAGTIAMTSWASWSPTINGFGTVTGVTAYWRRVGENMEISLTFTAGTPTAVLGTFILPNSKTIASWLPAGGGRLPGGGSTSMTSAPREFNCAGVGGGDYIAFLTSEAGSGFAFRNGNVVATVGTYVSLTVSVPIGNW